MQEYKQIDRTEGLPKFYAAIYGYMTLGLLMSAASAYLAIYSDTIISDMFYEFLYEVPYSVLILIGIELLLVVSLRFKENRIRSTAASTVLFILYSVVSGLTLGLITSLYTGESVMAAFISTAAMFGVLSVIGVTVKKDLSPIGRGALSALIGLIVTVFVNAFIFQSEGVSMMISIVTVIIFSILTAYDTQKIKYIYQHYADSAGIGSLMILCALELYLDFINIFLAVLRIFGKRN
ncbi:Bax inhibitor-1/YccA family protein [Isobaculum melis]|uniref:Modulator of FtsH protease n=1 Tax=Isobaculum melis TaxID=142588 RepID=A0A1H9U296_9LACT|nr:Bax inhibitor-1/YccA family protein [Isobaculum melis]SES03402.1 hypothetical protein SAMN04488559_12013 [Isobaculum melis]